MQWLFLHSVCVFLLTLFSSCFYSLSLHTHTGKKTPKSLGLLMEFRQVVAIARCVLKQCTPISQDYRMFKAWLVYVRDKPASDFPLSHERNGKNDIFRQVLLDRQDPEYDWLGTGEEKEEYVKQKLREFAAWKDSQALAK